MKIIHCADIHLDSKLRANLTPGQARERRNEILLTFERMIAYGKEKGIQAVLIAGDLFDTGSVTVKTRNTVAACITENPSIEFYYLKGNHDVDNFISIWEELPKNLHLFSNQWKSYELENINSELLATLLKSRDNQENFYSFVESIEEYYTELEEIKVEKIEKLKKRIEK
jgi:DNA repair exonuclease SbcCD nuclease subunit